MPTATSARSSRSRSSRRCEISVPSASFSGSSLIGARRGAHVRAAGVGGMGVGVGLRQRGSGLRRRRRRRGRRGRRRGALRAAGLLQLHFFLQLLAELARHGARAADPAAEFGDHARQLFRSQHDERQDENDQDLGKSPFEQIYALRSVLVSVFFASVNSASASSARSCFGALCSSSPSLIAFLKPRTAWPRSEPTVRSFLAPNTTNTTSRMITSSRIPKPPIVSALHYFRLRGKSSRMIGQMSGRNPTSSLRDGIRITLRAD